MFEPTIEFRLLGQIDFDRFVLLQERLVEEARQALLPRIEVLLCEHPRCITIGRIGSRAHVRMDDQQLQRRQLDVRWVGRGGGCVLHAPGQLAIYPIVPLDQFGWTVGEYVRRFHTGIVDALESIRVKVEADSLRLALVSRTGVTATFGIAVRHWVTSFGAVLNVNPAMTDFRFVDAIPPRDEPRVQKTTMGSLVAERRRPVKMSELRSALVPHLAAAFDCQRYHLHTGHSLMPQAAQQPGC